MCSEIAGKQTNKQQNNNKQITNKTIPTKKTKNKKTTRAPQKPRDPPTPTSPHPPHAHTHPTPKQNDKTVTCSTSNTLGCSSVCYNTLTLLISVYGFLCVQRIQADDM